MTEATGEIVTGKILMMRSMEGGLLRGRGITLITINTPKRQRQVDGRMRRTDR